MARAARHRPPTKSGTLTEKQHVRDSEARLGHDAVQLERRIGQRHAGAEVLVRLPGAGRACRQCGHESVHSLYDGCFRRRIVLRLRHVYRSE